MPASSWETMRPPGEFAGGGEGAALRHPPTHFLVLSGRYPTNAPTGTVGEAHRPRLEDSGVWKGGNNIVGGYGSANSLEFKLANWLDLHGILDSHQHTRANQDLTGLGFVAEPRSDVGDCSDILPMLKRAVSVWSRWERNNL
jgi:hypothetical protein